MHRSAISPALGIACIPKNNPRFEGWAAYNAPADSNGGVTMTELCPIDNLEGVPPETHVVRTIKHGDPTYELYAGACQCGAHPVFRLMRLFGSSLSIYELSAEDCRNLDEYVANLHESFSIDVVAKLTQLRATIAEFNSKGFFETEGVHPFNVRLIDKARLIANRLSKQGKLQEIIDHADDSQHDLASAFILGCIATENHWLTVHEDAVFEGYAHIEGRESGRPLALAIARYSNLVPAHCDSSAPPAFAYRSGR